jgi:hypothetical protein
MNVLRQQGLAEDVDFLYTPGNLKLKQNCGYAFVNFTKPESAAVCLEKLCGFNWDARGKHVCEVDWCLDHQGIESHVERYRDSRIMHASVEDEYKPAIFRNGVRMPFPSPSKPLHKPRLRNA